MTNNPFATEEAWDVSGGFLGAGDHVCEVREVDGSGNSSGGHPEVHITVGNATGQIQDWIVVIPQTIGKIVQLTDACALDRPNDDQVKLDGSGYRIHPDYLKQLVGKKVGVIVRPEPDRMDPTKTRDRVKGYVPAGKIAASDVTPAGAAAAFSGGGSVDDDIPF